MSFNVRKGGEDFWENSIYYNCYFPLVKADYFDIYKGKLDDLERRLKVNNADELSQ